jgi:Zn-dependent protease/predicted transcriptional regulator
MALPSHGVRAGSVAGIEVRLDWSLIVIFWLILVNLATGTFALHHPGWSPGLRWATGAVAAVLFLLSILAHELAHALVGRAQGVEIAGITLFMFGGVARTKTEPQSARRELLMTVVGPLTSILIGVAAWFIGNHLATPTADLEVTEPFRRSAALGPLGTLLLWLGPVNIVLGLFNLVPAFPLDGGRVLRAALWAATGDLRKATRWAAGLGRVFATLFVLAGVSMVLGLHVPYLGSGLVPGLWIAFIGWFLQRASAASYARAVVEDVLRRARVADLMQRGSLLTVPPDLSVDAFVQDRLVVADQQGFPVTDGERFVGMVTRADVRRIPREAWGETKVRDIMVGRAALAVATPDEQATAAFEKLAARDVEQLPVVEGDRLVGLLRRRDLARWLDLQNRGAPLLRQRRV